MKKTYNINISGYSFIIEDDAYETLDCYLNTLSAVCDNAGERETAEDIEQRIAEIFTEKFHGSSPGIITSRDVETVIQQMGNPEDIIDTTVEIKSEIPPTPRTPPPFVIPRTIKKLYRDINDKVLGGVCSGLAWYIGIDPVWVRIVAVVAFFLSASWAALIYIVLWIVVPPAKSPFERLQMTGTNPSIQNIGRAVTDSNYNGYVPSRSQRGGTSVGNVILMILTVFALLLVGGLLIVMGVTFVGCVIALCLTPVGGVSEEMTKVRLILGCVIGGSAVAGIPLFILFRSLIGSITERHLSSFSVTQNILLALFWLMGVAAVIVCGILL